MCVSMYVCESVGMCVCATQQEECGIKIIK